MELCIHDTDMHHLDGDGLLKSSVCKTTACLAIRALFTYNVIYVVINLYV